MPVLSVVIPRLQTNQLCWTFTGAFEVHNFILFIYFKASVAENLSFSLWQTLDWVILLFLTCWEVDLP